MVDVTRVEVVNYHGNIGYEAENHFLLKFFIPPFFKKFAEITLAVKLLDHAQMASIVNIIVNDFDDKWMRVLFHEPDFLEYCLMLCLVQEFNRKHWPFDCKHSLIMLPGGSENSGKAALSYKVILVSLKGVGVIALLGTTS